MIACLRFLALVFLTLFIGTISLAEDLEVGGIVDVTGHASVFEVPDILTFLVWVEVTGKSVV